MQLSIDQILDAERRLAVKPALSRALSIVTGGVEATAFFDSLREPGKPKQSVCGAVWRWRTVRQGAQEDAVRLEEAALSG